MDRPGRYVHSPGITFAFRAKILRRGGGQQPIVGEQPQSQTVIVDATTPGPQQLEIGMMRHGFLRAAAARSATVAIKSVGGKKYG